MITCRECNREFPKPTTRGRPPVKCPECRAGTPVTTQRKPLTDPPGRQFLLGTGKVKTELDKPESVPVESESSTPRRKKFKLISGFCNKRHAPEIHLMCGLTGCTCTCHTE